MKTRKNGGKESRGSTGLRKAARERMNRVLNRRCKQEHKKHEKTELLNNTKARAPVSVEAEGRFRPFSGAFSRAGTRQCRSCPPQAQKTCKNPIKKEFRTHFGLKRETVSRNAGRVRNSFVKMINIKAQNHAKFRTQPFCLGRTQKGRVRVRPGCSVPSVKRKNASLECSKTRTKRKHLIKMCHFTV